MNMYYFGLKSPGKGNGNLHKYSCLGNSMQGTVLWVTVLKVARVRHDLVTACTHLLLQW